MVMNKVKSIVYSIIMAAAFITPSASMMAGIWSDCCNWYDCCGPLDIAIETRVAYYRPSSGKVRRIYGDGWTDYQLEVSKGFCRDWRIWAGVNGFSRNGNSIGFHNRTTLQLVPVNFGVKYFPPFFPMCKEVKFFIGAAACYSFLNIKDHSEYILHHTHKTGWGGLIQAGINYYFWEGAYVSLFADGYFQEFGFHNSYVSSGSGLDDSRSSEDVRKHLDMSGFKIGVSIGYNF